MNKIKEILNNPDSVLIFDVDGCLAKLEFGEYNHYSLNDDAWAIANNNGINYYDDSKVCYKLKKYLESRDMNNIYVATKVLNDNEGIYKIDFLERNYKIKKENIYNVYSNNEKLDVMNLVKNKYNNLEDKMFVIIDDTVEVLSHVMDNSNYSTAHISTFLDI